MFDGLRWLHKYRGRTVRIVSKSQSYPIQLTSCRLPNCKHSSRRNSWSMNWISEPAERTEYELNQSRDTCGVLLLHNTLNKTNYSQPAVRPSSVFPGTLCPPKLLSLCVYVSQVTRLAARETESVKMSSGAKNDISLNNEFSSLTLGAHAQRGLQ